MTKLEELKAAAEAADAAANAAEAAYADAGYAFQDELNKPKITELEELKAAALAEANDAWEDAETAEAAYKAELKKSREK
jgi:hypothetical protein